MILTCPECATSYFVDDSRVPAAGRAVKCSHCGAKWTAKPEIEPEVTPAQPALALAAEAPPADEVVAERPETPVAAEEPFYPRRRPATRPSPPPAPPKPQGGPVLVWVVAAAVVVGLVAGLLVFRSEVARLVPATRSVYASVGMPAEPFGLVIEGVKADATFQGGRPALAVTGQIRNVQDKTALAPSLKVSLLDKAGKPLSAKVARPIDGRVPPGAVRHFAISIVDPPADVHDLQVTFEKAGRAAALPRAAEAVVAGPAPVDAQPLPDGSPDALQRHD